MICVKGYLNNPAADTDYFTQDGFATMGDLGYYDEEGRLYFKDRIKEVIKVGLWSLILFIFVTRTRPTSYIHIYILTDY